MEESIQRALNSGWSMRLYEFRIIFIVPYEVFNINLKHPDFNQWIKIALRLRNRKRRALLFKLISYILQVRLFARVNDFPPRQTTRLRAPRIPLP